MTTPRFSILIGIATFLALFLGSPDVMEGQSAGVLRASVEVVDFEASFAAMKAIRAGAVGVHQPGSAVTPHVVALSATEAPRAGRLQPYNEEPLVVIVTYLN